MGMRAMVLGALLALTVSAGELAPAGPRVGTGPLGHPLHEAGGIRYHLRGFGPPLLMAGGPWSGPFLEALAVGRQLILLDGPALPGTRELAGLLDLLGAPRVDLLGVGPGADRVSRLVLAHPERARRAVLHEAPGKGSTRSLPVPLLVLSGRPPGGRDRSGDWQIRFDHPHGRILADLGREAARSVLLFLDLPLEAVPAPGGAGDEAVLEGLPPVGRWMMTASGRPAHWLGRPWRGKELLEPVNILIEDALSRTPEEAMRRLAYASALARYDNRVQHSSGYAAFLDGRLLGQFPPEEGHALSDDAYTFPNHHGRLFGPCWWQGRFWFSGAFSREGVEAGHHVFESFPAARDDFARRLAATGEYRLLGSLDLGNGQPPDPLRQTVGDHDGRALHLAAGSPGPEVRPAPPSTPSAP